MTRILTTVALLFGSNIFMTWAWYGHLKKAAWSIPLAIAVSWMIALPEYMLQVPANRIGHVSQGGPFSAAQLKVLQEAITLTVFIGFAILILKEKPRVNEYIAFALIFAGVAVAMIGRREEPRQGQIIEAPAAFMVPAIEPAASDSTIQSQGVSS
ncbi:MAG: DMT family protein [Phycisphaeraceae bacterium]|nr:DMT family protein [Phycisphaeraceae bacterium]MCW5763851.1 DMT family protein [Phycisphaeraceae bacterium]